MSVELQKRFHKYVSRQTVIRRLIENHFKYRKLFKVRELSDSQIILRYNFATLLFKNIFDFKKEMIVFSDEALFSFRPDNHKWWVKEDDISENATTNIRKYPFGALIWDAIGRDYKTKLIFIDKRVNQYRYKQLLKDSEIFKELDQMKQQWYYLFQRDGATCHQTPMVMCYLNRIARATYLRTFGQL